MYLAWMIKASYSKEDKTPLSLDIIHKLKVNI